MIQVLLPAQTGSPYLMKYQGVARNNSGVPIINQAISVRISIYSGSSSGVLVWQEIEASNTDQEGLFLFNIGSGTSTGLGTLPSFGTIPWQANNYFLKVEIDYSGSSSYVLMGENQLISTPYSFYASKVKSIAIPINDLTDVDTVGCSINKLLTYSGTIWKPLVDTDPDTVAFAQNSNSAVNAIQATSVTNAINSILSDTTTYASNFLPYNWSVAGNSSISVKFLGTVDSNDLRLSSSNIERIRVLASGAIGIGLSNPNAQLHIVGIDGLIAIGTLGSGILPDSSYNTRMMWFPQKAALRFGQISSNRWNIMNIGNYSLAAGYNCQASGLYSFASGYNCTAVSDNCISLGKDCFSNSYGISGGGSLAIGDSCIVTQTRSIAFGYRVINSGGVAMGYRTKVALSASTSAWGAYTLANGNYDIALGSYVSSNVKNGCFLYGDASTTSLLSNTTDNQFLVRASGGVVFYSDSALTNGVRLFPGSGAWASVSDRSKKENIDIVNPEDILTGISNLKISSWNYKAQNRKIRHIGPMAQDFYAQFNIGEDEKNICTVDMDGVILSGIKGVNQRTIVLYEKMSELSEVKASIDKLDDFSSLDKRVSLIEKKLEIKKR